METIKEIGTMILYIFVIVVGMVAGIMYITNFHEDEEWARTIKCKEVGGVWTYKSYVWYCK